MFTGPNIVTDGLVLYLDAANTKSYVSGSTTWVDIAAGNNGTFTNGPTFNSSNFGSIVFDGSDDYINVPYNSNLNTPNGATYEIWLKPTIGSSGEFLNRGTSDAGATPDNPRFYIYNTGKIYFDWSRPSVDVYSETSSNVTMGGWNQVVGVAPPNSALKIYINGSESTYSIQVQTTLSTLPNTTDPIQIGGATWINRFFNGNISIVRLYDRVLTNSEILQNYNAQKSRFGL